MDLITLAMLMGLWGNEGQFFVKPACRPLTRVQNIAYCSCLNIHARMEQNRLFQILSCSSELNHCKYDKFNLKATFIDVATLSFLKIIDKQIGSGLRGFLQI